MSELSTSQPIPLPEPRMPIAIRPGVLGDIAFIDQLQKKQSKQVGFFPTKALEGKISAGHVLIAVASGQYPVGSGQERERETSSLPTDHCTSEGLPSRLPTPVGYLIAQDQYFKRDDLGVIYQMNVVPEYRRSLVAATLLKAQFERSAYGCKLYCCWCAQDIEANRFWEAMGFVPLAYRTGSETRGKNSSPRVHIFWQKRIRQADTTTPWWFPSKTNGGAIGADRIVLPIPPGMNWEDELPLLIPENAMVAKNDGGLGVALPIEGVAKKENLLGHPLRDSSSSASRLRDHSPSDHSTRDPSPPAQKKQRVIHTPNGIRVAPPTPVVAAKEAVKRPKPRKPKAKCDPQLMAKARELRDRWMEAVNRPGGGAFGAAHANAIGGVIGGVLDGGVGRADLFAAVSGGKYDLSRAIAA